MEFPGRIIALRDMAPRWYFQQETACHGKTHLIERRDAKSPRNSSSLFPGLAFARDI
jgi:hypothetical protein